MVDSSDLSAKKVKKKRTLSSHEEKRQKPSKINRIDHDSAKEKDSKQETEEVASPWRNLQLILSIQNREIHLQKKVELAYDFVNSREKGGGKDADVDRETVKVSRVVAFLNDWVQSLLISTDKKIEVDGEGVIEACLDYRCWMIFKFCLEESLRLQVSLSFSRNLLRAIGCVARNVLSVLTVPSVRLKESFFTGSGFELYSVVLDCVSLVFLSHGGLSNENLDLWILSILPVLEFVRKVYGEKLEGGNVGVFALRFSCLVLEPFAKFLRVHPTRKNGFRDFVDKLLEPLLHLLGVLHLQSDKSNPGWTRNLLVAVEEVLSQGLFHPTHIDGFLSLRVAEKYSASNDGETKESKTVIQSYHRHFFDKLERIILAKKESAMSGLGELFYLLVDRVKKQKETLFLSDGMKIVERTEGSRHLSGQLSKTLYGSSTPLDTSYGPSILSAEKRKSLFNFFVQITDPLLLEINGYLQSKLEVRPLLLDVHCTIKSIKNLLACFLREKLYIKTEDISEGACLNFLKKVYNAILPFMANLLCLPTYNVDSRTQETFTLLARELLAAVGHLLDIEYEVIENDLTRLWFIMLSCLAFGYSFKDAPNECSMTSQILGLGCQLVKLYSELRQVKSTIFAICKATRLIIVYDKGGDAGLNYDSLEFCKISLPHASYAKAVEMLFCSHEFKLAIRNDICSIPEGQASECIQHLTADLSESMEWMKTTCSLADEEVFGESNANSSMHGFDLQVELFGRGLSEVYALVLDSLNVTAGNSSIVGRTMKDLMAVIRPYMSILVGPESESVNEFISSVTGRTSDVRLAGNTHDMLKFGVSTHWVLVFFSRMYMSCRSLYRQAVSQPLKTASLSMTSLSVQTLLVLIVFVTASFCMIEEASAIEGQREFDYFALSLQWPGTYCRRTRHCCSKNACCRGANAPTEFTIHGLWPDYNDGTWPACCTRSDFNEKEISTLHDALEKYWPSLSCGSSSSCHGTKGSFWAHEWEKHGTCSSPVVHDEYSYFSTTLNVYFKYNVTKVLNEAGYVPSNSEKYPLGGIVSAIENAFHATPQLVCSKGDLEELRICFYKDFKPRDCVIQNDMYTSKSSCPKYVSLPAYVSLGLDGAGTEVSWVPDNEGDEAL